MNADWEKKFRHRVEKVGECLVFNGYRLPRGYGRVAHCGKTMLAHRVSLEIAEGRELREFVLHRCDNPSCVNPEHLFEGSHQDNMADMARKGRGHSPALAGENHGRAKLTYENVVEIKSSKLSSYRLAKMFGVSSTAVRKVRSGKSWNKAAIRKIQGKPVP